MGASGGIRIPTLDLWDVVIEEGENDAYTPPELWRQYLRGYVSGSSQHEDGKFIHTSHIVEVDGNIVYTKHNMYKLLKPAKEYIEYCIAKGCHIPTNEEPIKVHK